MNDGLLGRPALVTGAGGAIGQAVGPTVPRALDAEASRLGMSP